MRKKEGNKEIDIINAAIQVFASKGFFNAKISEIAKKAKVSVGSVYVYYKSKDYVLYKIFDDVWGCLYYKLKETVARKDLSIEKKHDALIDMIFDTFTENTSIAIVIAHEQQRLLMRNPIEFTPYYEMFNRLGNRIIKEGIKQKVFNKEINPKISSLFLHGAFRELINNWANNQKMFSLNLIRKNIKSLSKSGLLKHK
ncbi:MAG: TetR/AcrR family transcriptional regulator [Ignavibacteria bacterium]